MKIKGIELMEMIFSKQLKEGQKVIFNNECYVYKNNDLINACKISIGENYTMDEIVRKDFELDDEYISTLPDYKDLDDYDVSDIKMNRFKINESICKMNMINNKLNELSKNLNNIEAWKGYLDKSGNCMTD